MIVAIPAVAETAEGPVAGESVLDRLGLAPVVDVGDDETADAERHQHQRHAARLEQTVDALGGGTGPAAERSCRS